MQLLVPIGLGVICLGLIVYGAISNYHFEHYEAPKCWYNDWVKGFSQYPYKVVKMDFDTVMHLMAVNPNRFKYCKSVEGGKFLAYNTNTEDKITKNIRQVIPFTDKDGSVRYIDWNGAWAWFYQGQVLEIEDGEKVTKAEDVWTNGKTIAISFSFEDYKKFLDFLDKEKERKKQEEETRNMKLVIDAAQSDIEKMRQQAEEEIQQANKMMQDVVKNITLQV